jgi:hypothetical protein
MLLFIIFIASASQEFLQIPRIYHNTLLVYHNQYSYIYIYMHNIMIYLLKPQFWSEQAYSFGSVSEDVT